MTGADKEKGMVEALSTSRILLGVFAVAALIRIAHVVAISDTPYFGMYLGDAAAFRETARSVAAGEWLGAGVLFHAPAYPYFLGLLYRAIGSDPLVVRLAQAMLGACTAAVTAYATSRLAGKRAAVGAGLVAAAYGPAVYYDTIFQDSVLDAFLASVVVWALVETYRTGSVRNYLLLGLALGLLATSRELALSLILVGIAWTAARHRHAPKRMVGHITVLSLGVALALAPLVARNWVVGEGTLPGREIQLGANLYIGNGDGADGLYRPLRSGRGNPRFEYRDAVDVASAAVGRSLSPAEAGRYWTMRTLREVVHSPDHWVALWARKLALVLNHKEFADTEAPYMYARDSLILRLLLFFNFGVLLVFSAHGARRLWVGGGDRLVFVAWPVAYLLGVTAFFVFGRYRHPAFPSLALLAGVSLAHLAGRLRHRSLSASSGVPAVASAALFTVSLMPIGLATDRMTAHALANVGTELEVSGDLPGAVKHFQQALALDPSSSHAATRLGVAFRQVGRPTEALQFLEHALEHQPDNPITLNEYGIALTALGRVVDAETQFNAAVRADSLLAEPRANLGVLALQQADSASAFAHLRVAAQLDGSNMRYWDLLLELAASQDITALDSVSGSGRRQFLDAVVELAPGLTGAEAALVRRTILPWAGTQDSVAIAGVLRALPAN